MKGVILDAATLGPGDLDRGQSYRYRRGPTIENRRRQCAWVFHKFRGAAYHRPATFAFHKYARIYSRCQDGRLGRESRLQFIKSSRARTLRADDGDPRVWRYRSGGGSSGSSAGYGGYGFASTRRRKPGGVGRYPLEEVLAGLDVLGVEPPPPDHPLLAGESRNRIFA